MYVCEWGCVGGALTQFVMLGSYWFVSWWWCGLMCVYVSEWVGVCWQGGEHPYLTSHCIRSLQMGRIRSLGVLCALSLNNFP